ncbi:helix-turn-helix domain-containing protein [Desulfobacter hydrogenophilus]|uniref:Helix-turn-helix domain-containing protein n=1 Tax=Desulfobacter hydrogenophilus TaxID=2291 RepID=A0A328FD61_9BACT|nr:helix-turn-helix domain-containing protein [Desulfobacter hydrogenophilus]NDY70480.1 helix-turn-helix domain-containing protein [Desulfobacter hydrogenophilus]QBH13857.1 helix-turn-helix domain-containing protein [Desulfobacter hydrogenophilus]RAM02086.1 helix-turn-helix domain-containing protein [Desulfobacter hydrogenophilus]
MKIRLHKNATTTPAQRAYIQNNPQLSVASLAKKIGVSKTTIRRWQNRTDVHDRSHTPKRIKTVLSPIEEIKIVICRMAFRAGLDDLLQISDSFFKIKCSRAGLNRCLRRYQISRMTKLKRSVPFNLKDYTGTYLYYNCFHLPSFQKNEPPVVLQTLLDCSFRTFHAQYTTMANTFLSDHIQSFPLKVLGVIYNDPVRLCTENTELKDIDIKNSGSAPDRTIEQLCKTCGLSFFHMDNLVTDIISELNLQMEKIVYQSDLKKDATTWGTNEALEKQIHHYNFELPLSFLKQKTPYQAMEAHYTHFPNSFNHQPMASVNTSCL